MRRVRPCLAVVSLLFLARSLAGASEGAEPRPLEVFVGIPPQAFLVERIGGERVSVGVLVQPGQEPHTYEPTPKQMMALGRAAIYFQVGMPFEERLVERIDRLQTGLKVVDAARGIEKRMMARHRHGDEDEHEDEHEHEAEHEAKGEPDPHVWLSPPLLKVVARNVAEALAEADPAHAAEYAANLGKLLGEIDALHERIRKVLAPHKGRRFFVFHPAFGYFGDAYGLEQEAVEMEGKSPTPRQLRELIQRARAENVRIIFVQPQFDRRSAESVARAIDGAVVPMDPLAKDVLANLEEMAGKVESALKRDEPAPAGTAPTT